MASPPKILFKTMTIIGIGLIGSSIALAARRSGVVEKIKLMDIDQSVVKQASELDLGDMYTSDYKSAVYEADLIVICAPVGAYESLAKEMAPHLKPGSILTDAGSVKRAAIQKIVGYLPDSVTFIPAHPIAGTEMSGPAAGFAELFENRWVIFTPEANVSQDKINLLSALWEAFGSRIEIMDAGHHDHVLAITSHIPHLIAFSLVSTASDFENVKSSEVIKFSASGFRDFTRIAASDPTMWRDVFLNNKQAILEMLGRVIEDIVALQRAIRWDDGNTLFELFSRSRTVRQRIIAAGQDTASADFGRGKAPAESKEMRDNLDAKKG